MREKVKERQREKRTEEDREREGESQEAVLLQCERHSEVLKATVLSPAHRHHQVTEAGHKMTRGRGDSGG